VLNRRSTFTSSTGSEMLEELEEVRHLRRQLQPRGQAAGASWPQPPGPHTRQEESRV